MKQLMRSKNAVLGGVCAGIAEYFSDKPEQPDEKGVVQGGVDPTLVRLLWTFLTVVSAGFFILAYILCWLIIPKRA